MDEVAALRVVEYAEQTSTSASVTASSSARTLGLLANAKHAAHAARSGVSVDGAGPVQSLDLRVVVAQLVGAVQELSALNKAQAAESKAALKAQAVMVAAQAGRIAELEAWKRA